VKTPRYNPNRIATSVPPEVLCRCAQPQGLANGSTRYLTVVCQRCHLVMRWEALDREAKIAMAELPPNDASR
jgi:hypothetical protein